MGNLGKNFSFYRYIISKKAGLISLSLFLISFFSLGQEKPSWINSMDSITKLSDTIKFFRESMPLRHKIQRQDFLKSALIAQEKFNKELVKIDSIIGSKKNIDSGLYFNGKYISAIATQNALKLTFPQTYNEGSFAKDFNVNLKSLSSLNKLKQKNKLEIDKFNITMNAMEIDPLLIPVVTSEYAQDLLALIKEVLTSFPDKLESFSYNDYLAYEQSKHLDELLRKINFRINFLKICYEKI